MGNSSSSLPYTIGEQTHPATRSGSGGWAIHAGSRKSDALPVTVFKASKPLLAKTPLLASDRQHQHQHQHRGGGTIGSDLSQILPALHHFQKSKTLVHPNILQTHATLDTDYPNGDAPYLGGGGGKGGPALIADPSDPTALSRTGTLLTGDLIIVTERCVPLSEYLDGLASANANANANAERSVAWGLHNLVSALGFLHNAAKLCHGNLCPHAIYVTPAGDFKLSNFALLTPIGIEDGGGGPTRHFRHFDRMVCPPDYRSPERKSGQYDAMSTGPVHSSDSYSLGAFIEGLYGHPCAGTGGQVPPQLRKAVQRLLTDSARMRPRVLPLLKCPVFDGPHIAAREFLDNIAVKPAEEKIRFMQSLPDLLGDGRGAKVVLDRDVAVHRVLPVLVATVTSLAGQDGAMTQDVHRREVLAAMPPLFQVAETYLSSEDDADTFQSNMAPVVSLLFQVNDRGVRGALLSRVPFLATRLDGPTLNSSVFEPMCSGFTDSSGPLRELTLKSTVSLVPRLSASNLEKLGRYLVRLQSDPESSIRTNTVIFIGKIAPHLGDNSRQKLILPAFARAMKDDFSPCRLAALKAVRACREYYGCKSVAERVLPAVCPHLMDMAEEVRIEAFCVLEEFLAMLKAESDRMAIEARTKAAAAAATVAAAEVTATTSTMSMSRSPGSSGGPGISSDLLVGAVPATTVATAAAAAAAAATTTTTTTPATSAPSSGGYFSSFGSWAATKITASASSAAEGPAAAVASQAAVAAAPASSAVAPRPAVAPAPAPMPRFASLSLTDAKIGGYGGVGKIDVGNYGEEEEPGADDDEDDVDDGDRGGGGWSDDDDGGGGGGGVDFGDAAGLAGTKSTLNGTGVSTPTWAKSTRVEQKDENDDFFSTFDSKPAIAATRRVMPRGTIKVGGVGLSKSRGTAAGDGVGVGVGGSSSGGKLRTPGTSTKLTMAQKKQQAGAKKLDADISFDGDGWDDF